MQVQIGSHSFTFDHVYGSTGTPSVAMFDQCVAPLVDGLFQGYNATVLAYGQVGIDLLIRQFVFVLDNHLARPRSSLNHLARIPCAIDAAKRAEKLGPPRWGLAHGKSQHDSMWSGARMEQPIPCSFFLFSPAVCAMMMGSSVSSRNPQMLIISVSALFGYRGFGS